MKVSKLIAHLEHKTALSGRTGLLQTSKFQEQTSTIFSKTAFINQVITIALITRALMPFSIMIMSVKICTLMYHKNGNYATELLKMSTNVTTMAHLQPTKHSFEKNTIFE